MKKWSKIYVEFNEPFALDTLIDKTVNGALTRKGFLLWWEHKGDYVKAQYLIDIIEFDKAKRKKQDENKNDEDYYDIGYPEEDYDDVDWSEDEYEKMKRDSRNEDIGFHDAEMIPYEERDNPDSFLDENSFPEYGYSEINTDDLNTLDIEYEGIEYEELDSLIFPLNILEKYEFNESLELLKKGTNFQRKTILVIKKIYDVLLEKLKDETYINERVDSLMEFESRAEEDKALEILVEVLRKKPKDPLLLFRMGQVYIAQHNEEEFYKLIKNIEGFDNELFHKLLYAWREKHGTFSM